MYNKLPSPISFSALDDAISTVSKNSPKASINYSFAHTYTEDWENLVRTKLQLAFPYAASTKNEMPADPKEFAQKHHLPYSTLQNSTTAQAYVQPPLTKESLLSIHRSLSAGASASTPFYHTASEHDPQTQKKSTLVMVEEVLGEARSLMQASHAADVVGETLLESS